MSRVGKVPVEIPSGVKASVDGARILVEGPKGKINKEFSGLVKLAVEDGKIVVEPGSQRKQALANWGTARAIIANMVKGVVEGWTKTLELSGVGFTANMAGNELVLATGYSHKTNLKIPQGITCKVEKQTIHLECCDKQVVGEFAATVRRVCPPEPYLGKGIKYSDEVVRRKAGKAGGK